MVFTTKERVYKNMLLGIDIIQVYNKKGHANIMPFVYNDLSHVCTNKKVKHVLPEVPEEYFYSADKVIYFKDSFTTVKNIAVYSYSTISGFLKKNRHKYICQDISSSDMLSCLVDIVTGAVPLQNLLLCDYQPFDYSSCLCFDYTYCSYYIDSFRDRVIKHGASACKVEEMVGCAITKIGDYEIKDNFPLRIFTV